MNIDSIETVGTQKEKCNTNVSDAKTSNVKQETHGAKENCTSTDEDLKNTSNVSGSDNNINTNTPRHVAYVLQKLFKDELDWLQKLHIITSLGVDKTAECCNSFVFIPKGNGKVRLCLDPAVLNQTLNRPVHRGPTLNNILPRLNNVKCMSIIDASSWYCNLKLDEKSSYLTTLA